MKWSGEHLCSSWVDSLAKTLSVPRPINQAEQFHRIFPFRRTTFCRKQMEGTYKLRAHSFLLGCVQIIRGLPQALGNPVHWSKCDLLSTQSVKPGVGEKCVFKRKWWRCVFWGGIFETSPKDEIRLWLPIVLYTVSTIHLLGVLKVCSPLQSISGTKWETQNGHNSPTKTQKCGHQDAVCGLSSVSPWYFTSGQNSYSVSHKIPPFEVPLFKRDDLEYFGKKTQISKN